MRPEIMMLNIFEREGWYERRLVGMEAEVERLQEKHNELRRLDEAEESCAELARMLKTVVAERDRYKAALRQLAKHCNDVDYWQVADEAMAEAVRP